MVPKSNPGSEATDSNGGETNIIVVGDWFVDEHWVTGVHRSGSASRTGQSHHRAIQELNGIIEAFCGAGRTASLLYQVGDCKKGQKEKQRRFSIYGIGIWHREDKDILKSMFVLENLKGENHHRLWRKPVEPPPGVFLYNLGKTVEDPQKEEDYLVGTSRIVRMYHHAASGRPIQYIRVDWELEGRYQEAYGPPIRELEPGEVKGFLDTLMRETGSCDDHYRDQDVLPTKDVGAVVLKDLRRGVVSKALVEWFAERYEDVPWFVSTKAWTPDWLDVLKKVNLRVLLIPQVAAREAIGKGELACWITRAGYPDERAMNMVDELVEKTIDNDRLQEGREYRPRIIVLPEGFKVLAYDPHQTATEGDRDDATATEGKRYDALVQEHADIGDPPVDMGMASVFLPALVVSLIDNPDKELKGLVEEALRHTYEWVHYESRRITRPNSWDGRERFMDIQIQRADPPSLNTEEFSWEDEREIWQDAMDETGVVKIKGHKRLHLWRSMIEIDGYVCCVLEKKKKIHKLMREIEDFRRSGRRHHVCSMLVASPGSGKTFFVRQLAKALDFQFLSFNITQMVSRSDILDCFDTIVTTQAQDRDRPQLVFVDEINAQLEGDLVYNAFLAPIEDGVYVRGGKLFHIDPCVWVFSGTEEPTGPKGSDFKSRLTLGVEEIDRCKDHSRMQTEIVYRAVAMIREEFPDVRSVSEGVLKLFLDMKDDVSVRAMKNFIKSFVNIQYGKISITNIRDEAMHGLIQDGRFNSTSKESWEKTKKDGDGDLVEIEST
jgi:hypothetical protein